jgi:oligoribonuclease
VGVVLDIETTGLDVNEDRILEVGAIAYDIHFNEVASIDMVVCGELESGRVRQVKKEAEAGREPALTVANMHEASGLFDMVLAGEGVTAYLVAPLLGEWAFEHGVKGLPLTGSSIAFDRKFLERHIPEAERLFHYRSIDVSGIREWMKIWNPALERSIDAGIAGSHAFKAHRSLPDCRATLALLKEQTSGLVP